MGLDNFIQTAMNNVLKNPILSILRDINFSSILKQSNFIKRDIGKSTYLVILHFLYMFVINREYLSYKHMRGFNFRMANRWTNIGHMIRLVSLGKNPTNLIKAQWCCERNRKLIKQGKIKELYWPLLMMKV